jgi:hypothetical protein
MNTLELEFLKRHPSYAFHAISGFYPLSGEQLRKYRDVLFWEDVYENEEIEWSIGLVQTFLKYLKDEKGKLNSILHYNNKLPWSVEFIKQFETLWYWDILGERDEIQNNPLIQKVFEKHLEPVNAWIASLRKRFSKTNDSSIKEESTYNFELKHWKIEEIEQQKNTMDWHELSIGGSLYNWNFAFLNSYDSHIDFDALIGNKKAWIDCFGVLSCTDIEFILRDKEIQSKAVYKEPELKMSDVEKSHFEIPECLTYRFFLKNNWNLRKREII